MRYTTKIGTYLGIPVRVHATFPVILMIFGADGWVRGGLGGALEAVGFVMCVFACVVLHELGHSLQARRFGISVRDIILLPIGGLARADRIPESPLKEIVIAIAGPLVNFVLAGLMLIVLKMRGAAFDIEGDFVSSIAAVNLVLGVFNLIPAFPMDGGRILRGLLATRLPYLTATSAAKDVGQLIAVVFIVAGFYFPQLAMLPLIAIFVFWGATTEEALVRARYAPGTPS